MIFKLKSILLPVNKLSNLLTRACLFKVLSISITLASSYGYAAFYNCSTIFTHESTNTPQNLEALVNSWKDSSVEDDQNGKNDKRLFSFPLLLFDLIDVPGKIEKQLRKNEPAYSIFREQELEYFNRLPKAVSSEVQDLIHNALNPKKLSDSSILIKIDSNGWINSFSNETSKEKAFFSDLIQSRFSSLYQEIVIWIYQKNGLEEYSPLTSAKMIDEQREYISQGSPMDYFLLFDAQAWHAQMLIIEMNWQEYKSTHNTLDSWRSTQMFGSNIFWPFAGVAIAKPTNNSKGSVELKRYFKNDIEDPFEILNISKKDDYTLRQELLLHALEELPPNTVIQIHSHTKVHTLAYQRLGFNSTSQIQNPKYPNATIDLLEANKEEVIKKIKILLQQRQAERLNQ
ncbi:MAG: hypothetical protein ACXVCY_19240 [Pseudobdellovibrionaceae bacterium]